MLSSIATGMSARYLLCAGFSVYHEVAIMPFIEGW